MAEADDERCGPPCRQKKTDSQTDRQVDRETDRQTRSTSFVGIFGMKNAYRCSHISSPS